MKNWPKKKSVFSIVALVTLVGVSYFLSTKKHHQVIATAKSKKKDLVVNGRKYDGAEKFAYYLSAIRAGQEDLNAKLIYPQYEDFYRSKELKKSRNKRSLARTSGTTAVFKERGPANVPGRTRAIVADPDDPTGATWIAGNVSGGLWKTTNSGESWVELAPDLNNLAIVTLAMSESNPSVIYAGTGEGFVFNGTFILNGDGIYKSTDKGVSWIQLPSTKNDDFINVSRIIVDPTNENILLASTTGRKIIGGNINPVSSIMRSIDGGQTWTKVFGGSSPVQQIIAAPSDFNIQYASIRATGAIKSTDAGLNWTNINTGLSLTGRMELAVSHSDPDKVYGSAEGSLSGTGADMYMTSDGGTNWTPIAINVGRGPIDFFDLQGWYDNTIMVNPFDDNHVYFGGVTAFNMTVDPQTSTANVSAIVDSRNQYGGINNDGGGSTVGVGVHPDFHFMAPIITDEDAKEFKILMGNDGGIYVSDIGTSPGTTQGSWTWAGADYNTTQFYGADKVAGTEEYLGGTQDNGTWVSVVGETASSTSDYEFYIGGDGFEVVAHYTDPNKFIGGSQFNGFVGTEDRKVSVYPATNGLSGNGPFVSRLSNAYQDPDVLFAVESGGVYRSVDFGKNWRPSVMNGIGWNFWNGSDVEVSKADPRIVWAGGRMSSSGNLFVSLDGGLTFDPVPNFANIGLCTGIYSHPTDPNSAFAVFSVADSPKILKTTNLGQTWTDLSGYSIGSNSIGFPNVAVFSVLAMPYDDDILWAGTEIGLFESMDGGASWNIVDAFSSVTIWDMKIKDGQVILATHGRGIWTADINELSGFTAPMVTLSPRITEFGVSLGTLEVKLSVDLRSDYDVSKVYSNGEKVKELLANAPNTSEDVTITVAEPGLYEVQVISTKGGVDYFTEKIALEVFGIEPVDQFYEDFEDVEEGIFSLNNFTIDRAAGFNDKLLNTTHPYPTGNVNLIANLNQPIIVADQNATLRFNEVVHVEEGNTGTNYTQIEFWDYVIVEASTNGINWTPVIDGYDAQDNSQWTGSASTASESQLVERSIDLLNTFNAGDIIVLRFRLFSDALANGWGWGIDDLEIQTVDEDNDGFNSLVDCDDTNANIYPGAEEIPNNDIDEDCNGEDEVVSSLGDTQFDAMVIYPNPASHYLNFTVSQDIKSINVYGINGEKIGFSNMDNGRMDVSTLKPGTYFVSIQTKKGIIHNKFVKQ